MIRKLLGRYMDACRDHSEGGATPVPGSGTGDITEILQQCATRDPRALASVFDRLYPELHRMAAARMRVERRDHTWQPTALLNEFFLRMARQTDLTWKNRAHFFAVASRAMRPRREMEPNRRRRTSPLARPHSPT